MSATDDVQPTRAADAPHAAMRARLPQLLEAGGTGTLAVLVLDVDGLRNTNVLFGHRGGDELLDGIFRRLEAIVRDGGYALPAGGGEFVVLMPEAGDEREVLGLVGRVVDELAVPFLVAGESVRVTVSVGVALAPADVGGDPEVLLHRATAAMHLAKGRGPGRVEILDDGTARQYRSKQAALRTLGSALATGALEVRFEPQVELSSGRVVALAATPWWTPPERAPISGALLSLVAARYGLAEAVGEYVLRRAVPLAAAWHRERPEDPPELIVRLSAAQLDDAGLPRLVASILPEAGLDPGALLVEVHASDLLPGRADRNETVRRLRALGVKVVLAGLGAPGSSLTSLREGAADRLQLDATFVEGVAERPEDEAVVAAIIDMGGRLALPVLADDVATAAQAARLARLGCIRGRGPFWGPPQHVPSLAPREAIGAPEGSAATEIDSSALADTAEVVAHELRTPLAVILGHAELLRPEVQGLLRERTDAILRAATRIERLLIALLDARLADLGRLPLQIEPARIVELVERLVLDTVPSMGRHRVTVHADIAPETVLEIDPARVEQVLGNLLSNAAKFTPAGAAIDVRLEPDPLGVAIVVRDHGPGIPPERAAEIFRKYGRLERLGQGTGLGLYLARQIAIAHGGDLRYRSAPGGGAAFCVVLPTKRLRPPSRRATMS